MKALWLYKLCKMEGSSINAQVQVENRAKVNRGSFMQKGGDVCAIRMVGSGGGFMGTLGAMQPAAACCCWWAAATSPPLSAWGVQSAMHAKTRDNATTRTWYTAIRLSQPAPFGGRVACRKSFALQGCRASPKGMADGTTKLAPKSKTKLLIIERVARCIRRAWMSCMAG